MLNEMMNQAQAKESTEIPDNVYNLILTEISKIKIDNLADLSPKKMRDILKKLRLNSYYEHIPHIINKLNGIPPPTMCREVEERIRCMFKEMEPLFIKYRPHGRKNFLSYNYVMYKCCELLELDEYLECFTLLKARDKLKLQDDIWEKICGDLRWEFIKTV
jgi:hypothetical protein